MATKCPKCNSENPDTKQFCGDCGTQLIPSEALQVSKTLTLETQADELTRGTVFAGRYEILEELGTGGMGSVYRVFDRKLEEEVALKLIRPDIAASRKTVERFKNEIKVARKITHLNVCRMHDLHEEGKILYITMEYVRGEDLKSVIHRMGTLTMGKAVSIAKQAAEGLAEAHKLGIVHRDLKPGNIMIDKDGNAKIMDFGIARTLAAIGTTAEGTMIGTPEYMSPEQVEGKPADARSDLYSLGVILFEMVTGQPPFQGDTPLSIAHKHRYELPPDPQKLNSHIPDGLNRTILRLLEKDREKRYQTADELIADFTAVEEALPKAEQITLRRRPLIPHEITVKFTLKKVLWPALAAVGLIIAALFIWKSVLNKPLQILPEERRSIAVISFENQTGDQAYEYLGKVIPNLLITNLEQSGYFNVTTWERLRDLLKQVGKGDVEFISSDLGFELCQKDAVEVIVLGLVSKSGNTFVTDAKVLEVGTKKLLATANSRGDSPDSILKTQVDELSRQIAKGVGISERKAAAAVMRIEGITTNSLEAYNYYLKGEEEVEKLLGVRARRYFERAVELDPNFGMALRRLGGESLKKAMAISTNMSEKERLYVEASYADLIEGDISKSISKYREIVNKYPKEKTAYYRLGNRAQDPQKAIEMYRQAVELDPNFGMALNMMGYTLLALKQYDQAVETLKRYVTLRPGDANPLDSLADAYFQLGRLDDAVETYEKALQVDPSFFGSMLAIGYICALREAYSEASEWIDKAVGVAMGREKPYAYLWKAFYFAWLGNREKSFSNIQIAEDLSDALKYELGKAIANRLRAWVYYDSGDFELSRKHNSISLPLLIKNPYIWESYHFRESYNTVGVNFLNGLIDLGQGKIESAKSNLAEMNSLTSDIPRWSSLGFIAKETVECETEGLRGALLLHDGSFERAVVSLQKFTVPIFVPMWGQPDISKFRYNMPFQRDALARAYVGHGEIDKAIAEYERLITFDPTKPARILIHPLYHYRLGILYEQKGLKNRAKLQYECFLEL